MNKAQAKAAGLKRYRDENKLCPKHPDGMRRTNNGKCEACRREAMAALRRNPRNKARAAAKAKGFIKYHDEERLCPKHPGGMRFVSNGGCTECSLERSRSSKYVEYRRKYRSTPQFKERARKRNFANRLERRAKSRKKRRDNPERFMLNGARRRARNNGLNFNLTIEDIKIPTHCPYFNEKVSKSSARPGFQSQYSPTLDRIDNRLGYVKGNVEVISWKANRLKGDATLEELVMMGKRAQRLLKQRAMKRRSKGRMPS